MSIISYHSLQTVHKTISDQIVFATKIRLKGRILDVLGYIYNRLFFSVANSEWHFSQFSSFDNVTVTLLTLKTLN